MRVVYIAGPFRAKTAWQVEQNVRRAEELGLEVAKLGAMPLIPHTNTRFFDGELTAEFWLDGTLELLKRCDAIVMGPRWEESSGARAELAWAVENSLPVFYHDEPHLLGELVRSTT